jgi:acetyl esterase/lipase
MTAWSWLMVDNADTLQARLFVPDSNTVAGQRILDNAPPPPPGFGQFMGFLEALAHGTIRPVNLAPDLPAYVRVHRSLVFCTVGDRNLELDLFTPGNATERVPVVLLIHGGCWMAGARQNMEFYGVALARLGYATATMDYRLSEEAPYPAAVDDCRAAVQWLTNNGDQYNIDTERIAVLGAFAGGHLAQFLGYTSGPAVKAVLSLYGWTDLTDPAVNYQYYMELFLGAGYADAPELYERASPITHVREGAPPTLILGGTIDTIVPITQAQKLARTLAQNDVPYVYAPVRGAYHGFDIFTDFNPAAMYFIEQFLAAYLGAS